MSAQTVLHRVPHSDNRLARFTEIVSGILNSLFRTNKLVFKGGPPLNWSIAIDPLSGKGAPPASLGEKGAIYIDVSDPGNLQFWYKS